MLEIINPTVVGVGVAAVLFVGILVFLMVGRWLGTRSIRNHGTEGLTNVSSLEAAVFALLGLLIAFSFSGALSRFDGRRAQAVDEANAIGSAYLRLDLLPAAPQPALRDNMRKYVDARIATYKALPDVAVANRQLHCRRICRAPSGSRPWPPFACRTAGRKWICS